MSYDLYFRPRSGQFTPELFERYFSSRSHYKVDLPQAWYDNPDTGVYFSFELQDAEEEEPIAFNMNFFRPSFFGLEAQPEVAAFVHHFDMTVADPQMDGMGTGEYDSEKFLAGWNKGNAFGYAAILGEQANRAGIIGYPTAKLLSAWTWNLQVSALQAELGEAKFVPKVVFVLLAGQPVMAAVWPDGIPIAVPEVDVLIVPRKTLAPRSLFRQPVEDRTLLAPDAALPMFSRYRAPRRDDLMVLNYDTPPKEIAEFVRNLPSDARKIEGVAPEKALNRELIDKAIR